MRFLKFVIPCYNCEKIIGKMLDSILNQTSKDFFIVLVDDLSTDNTFKLLKDYEKLFPAYIKAVQVKEKSYADGAREYGFKQYDDAKFIWFVDADDQLIDNNVIQTLKKIDIEKDCDIYTFNSNVRDFDLYGRKYGWPTCAPWFRITKSEKTVFHVINNRYSNDVIQSLMQYDFIKDEKIFHINEKFYKYCGSHSHDVNRECFNKVLNELSKIKFNKQSIIQLIKTYFKS